MLNSRKNLGIVLLTNEKYLFACGTMIINILDKIEGFANIIVYHESLSDESCKSLIELDRRVILREFGKNEFRSQFPFVVSKILGMMDITMALFARFHVNGSWKDVPSLLS